jgi:hypothetical protein
LSSKERCGIVNAENKSNELENIVVIVNDIFGFKQN